MQKQITFAWTILSLYYHYITSKLLYFTQLCGLPYFLPKPFNIFTQRYVPYLWHFATLFVSSIHKMMTMMMMAKRMPMTMMMSKRMTMKMGMMTRKHMKSLIGSIEKVIRLGRVIIHVKHQWPSPLIWLWWWWSSSWSWWRSMMDDRMVVL